SRRRLCVSRGSLQLSLCLRFCLRPCVLPGLGQIQGRRFRRKGKPVPLLERGHIFHVLLPGVAHFQQASLQHGNSVGEKLRQRPVQIVSQRRIQRVLEYVRQLRRNLRKPWKAVARRSAAERVRRNVQPL